jgi:DNA-binding Lrp family transcriptional regulator
MHQVAMATKMTIKSSGFESGLSLKKLVRRSFEHGHLNLVSAAEDAVTHLKDLFEFDEDQFVEVVEEVIDDGISKDFGYEISRSILNFADTDSVFVGTYFAVLSGADLIDPSVMQAVAEIKVYPFYYDIDEFNRSKCPAASVALSSSVTEELLEVLAKSNEIDIEYRVVLNSNTNEQTLLHIVQNSIQYQEYPEFGTLEFILGTIALHRNSTAKVIQALDSSPFASTSQAISLRMKATKPLCKVVNSDCAQLSPKSVFGSSSLWWEFRGMSWAIPGISCSQGMNCHLGIGDNSE